MMQRIVLTLFVQELVHDFLAGPEVCMLDAFERVSQIQEITPPRPNQNTERPDNFYSLLTRRDYTLLVVH
jgi:hypothetical protein